MTTTDIHRAQNVHDSHLTAGAVEQDLDVAHARLDSHTFNGDIEQIPQPVQATLDSHNDDGGLGVHAPVESHTRSDSQPVQISRDSHERSGGLDTGGGDASTDASEARFQLAHPRTPSPHPDLADPLLSFLGAIVDDLEDMRKANENRLRQLTRKEVDSDGEMRGFGLDETVPAVAKQIGIVQGLAKLERDAVRNLEDRMANHPLAVFAEQRGVGLKSLARLLAVIGDPYWNSLAGETRGLRQLWAYSGLHNVPIQAQSDSHSRFDGDSAGGNQDHADADSHANLVLVAARRMRGQRANWSSIAKSRAYLIADTMLKSGNRAAYDARKALTDGKLHAAPCVQCGKKGKPAEIGSPWRDGHRHADAMRIVSKDHVLRPLWELSRTVHQNNSAASTRMANSQPKTGAAEPHSDSPTSLPIGHTTGGESDPSSAPPKGGLTSQNGFGGPEQNPGLSTALSSSQEATGEPGPQLPAPPMEAANGHACSGESGSDFSDLSRIEPSSHQAGGESEIPTSVPSTWSSDSHLCVGGTDPTTGATR